jgi:hypothetical protein
MAALQLTVNGINKCLVCNGVNAQGVVHVTEPVPSLVCTDQTASTASLREICRNSSALYLKHHHLLKRTTPKLY